MATKKLVPLDASKIRLKRQARYQAKVHGGVGKITDIATKRTGTWVTLSDDTRNVYVTVRPSQLYEV